MTMRPCWKRFIFVNPVEGVGGEKGVEEAGEDGVQCPAELGSLWDALSLGDLYRSPYTYGGLVAHDGGASPPQGWGRARRGPG